MTEAILRTPIAAAEVKPARARSPVSRKTMLSVGAALVVAAGGAAYITAPKGAETTDAAYI